MVVIKKFENTIPVDFGEFELRFVISDENIAKLAGLEKEINGIKEKLSSLKGDIKDLEIIYNLSKDLWVKLFDDEVFEKVYAACDKSAISTLVAIIQTIKGLGDGIQDNYSQDKFLKYLN
ncbi:hypothetical protein [Gemella sp. Musashino-2025]